MFGAYVRSTWINRRAFQSVLSVTLHLMRSALVAATEGLPFQYAKGSLSFHLVLLFPSFISFTTFAHGFMLVSTLHQKYKTNIPQNDQSDKNTYSTTHHPQNDQSGKTISMLHTSEQYRNNGGGDALGPR